MNEAIINDLIAKDDAELRSIHEGLYRNGGSANAAEYDEAIANILARRKKAIKLYKPLTIYDAVSQNY